MTTALAAAFLPHVRRFTEPRSVALANEAAAIYLRGVERGVLPAEPDAETLVEWLMDPDIEEWCENFASCGS